MFLRMENLKSLRVLSAEAVIIASAVLLSGCGSYTVIGETVTDERGALNSESQATEYETSAQNEEVFSLANVCPDTSSGEILSDSAEDFFAMQKNEVKFEERAETVYIQNDSVNVRTSPAIISGESGNVAFTADKGEEFFRTGYSDDFSRVERDGETYYISSDYLSVNKPAEETLYESGAQIGLDPSWKYADFSVINTGKAVLYKAESDRKGITVAVNAGHGTKGGSSVKTWCHPDKTPKVTGGTTAAGSAQAVAVSGGMTFSDGTSEASVTLKAAKLLKEKLLSEGYDVLMLRDGEDVQLDNVARTVIANNMADCHIALHWDGDGLSYDKGCFYMSTPDGLKAMEPVKSNWQKHHALGDSLIEGLSSEGLKIWGSNPLPTDLTQTSFSTVASVDIELGNQASDHSDSQLEKLTAGLLKGINLYFGQ